MAQTDLAVGTVTSTGHVVVETTGWDGEAKRVIAPCARCYHDDCLDSVREDGDAGHTASYDATGETAGLHRAAAAMYARKALSLARS